MIGINKKRIFFITHLYYPSIGGAERVFQRVAEGLKARGHTVTVLTSDALSTEHYFSRMNSDLPGEEEINGIRVVRESVCSTIYKIMRFFDAPLRRLGRVGVFLRPLSFGPHFYQTWRNFVRQPFDLVIAGPVPTSSIYYGFIYRLRNPQARFIVIPCLHIGDKLHTSPLNIILLRTADGVITLTSREKSYLRSRGVKEEKMFVLSSGVDEHLLKRPADFEDDRKEKEEKIKLSGMEPIPEDYVLYLGQEGEHKRIPFLIKAMIRLWDAGYGYPLVVAGARTNYSASIDRLISLLPAAYKKKIIRFNNITEEEKVRLLDSCLIMVNPSAYESFGIVFLEAWARGKPVIGADLPVLREIIRHGKNGLLFYRESIEDLSEKIRFLLDNRDYAMKLGEEGRKEVMARYTWPHIISSLAGFLRI